MIKTKQSRLRPKFILCPLQIWLNSHRDAGEIPHIQGRLTGTYSAVGYAFRPSVAQYIMSSGNSRRCSRSRSAKVRGKGGQLPLEIQISFSTFLYKSVLTFLTTEPAWWIAGVRGTHTGSHDPTGGSVKWPCALPDNLNLPSNSWKLKTRGSP